jgi:uncharacterized membrane protein
MAIREWFNVKNWFSTQRRTGVTLLILGVLSIWLGCALMPSSFAFAAFMQALTLIIAGLLCFS